MNYGLKNKSEISVLSRKVVGVFGGGYNATRALIEFAATETNSGEFPDAHPTLTGVGLTQFDQIGFDDVQQRTRPKNKQRLKDMLGYDLDKLKLADLAYDPLLALALTRLKLLLIPEEIPDSVEGRAKYWKKHWNTYHPNAKGTVEGYIAKVAKHA